MVHPASTIRASFWAASSRWSASALCSTRRTRFLRTSKAASSTRCFTYPFARWEMLLGKLLFNAAFSVVGVAVCMLAGYSTLKISVTPAAWLPIALWSVLGTAGWYFLFTWLALNLRGFNAYHTTTSALYLVLMFVSNLFYPTEQLPASVRWLAWANPVTWQTGLLRYYTYPSADPRHLPTEMAAFVGFVVVTFWLANRKLNGTIE